MNKPEKYFLPDAYQENPVRTTMDSESGSTYWHARRLADAYNYQYAVYRYLAKLLKDRNCKSLIDVGCGPAVKLAIIHNKLPHIEITGFDQPHPIQFCKDHHSFGKWYADDFENPAAELAHIKGDIVVCADVIEHVLDPDKLLSYLAARTDNGGAVLISTPDRDLHYGQGLMRSGHKDHIREWTKDEFAAYLASRGWSIERHFHLPGVRAGLNMAYLYAMAYHFLEKRPAKFCNNQVVLARPPA